MLAENHPLKELEAELLAPRIVCNGCWKPLDRVGEAHEGHWTPGDRFPDLCGHGVRTTLIESEDAAEALDAFAAAHPGLEDNTATCDICGAKGLDGGTGDERPGNVVLYLEDMGDKLVNRCWKCSRPKEAA